MGEHLLIVGARSPLAVATIDLFLERGDRVTCLVRDTAAGFPGEHAEHLSLIAHDLLDTERVQAVFDEAESNAGEVARLCFFQRYRGTGSDRDEMAVEVHATARMVDEYARRRSTDGDGSVTVITSPAAGAVALEQDLGYHTAKAALGQLVRFLALKLGARRIRVNAVRPALVLKDRALEYYEANPDLVSLFERITPLGRMARPHDIAEAVAFLSSARAAFITGHELVVDGGLSLHEAASLGRLASGQGGAEIISGR